MRTEGNAPRGRIFTARYMLVTAVNFFIYAVYFQLMLWSTNHALDEWQSSLSMAGLASGLFIVGALGSRIPAGRYIDVVGRKGMFLAGGLAYFLIMFLYELAPDPVTFMIVRFLHGMCFGMCSTAASTIVAAILPEDRMGEGIGYYSLATTLAAAIGPFLALSLPGKTIEYICFGCTLLVFLGAIVIKAPERPLTEEEKKDLKTISLSHFFARPSLLIASIAMLVGVSYSAVLSFLGAYAAVTGLTGYGTTLFFVFFAIASFLSRPVSGKLLDKRGGDIVVYPSLLAVALCMILVAFAKSGVMLLAAACLLGAGYGSLTAACHALSVHCAPVSQIGVATSTYFVMLDLGVGVGPYVLGNVVDFFGFVAVYLVSAAIMAASMVYYYLTMGRPGRFEARRMAREKEARAKEVEAAAL